MGPQCVIELLVCDDSGHRRRIRLSTTQTSTRVSPYMVGVPLRPERGRERDWCSYAIDLPDIVERAYGRGVWELCRVQVHAHCRLWRLSVSETPLAGSVSPVGIAVPAAAALRSTTASPGAGGAHGLSRSLLPTQRKLVGDAAAVRHLRRREVLAAAAAARRMLAAAAGSGELAHPLGSLTLPPSQRGVAATTNGSPAASRALGAGGGVSRLPRAEEASRRRSPRRPQRAPRRKATTACPGSADLPSACAVGRSSAATASELGTVPLAAAGAAGLAPSRPGNTNAPSPVRSRGDTRDPFGSRRSAPARSGRAPAGVALSPVALAPGERPQRTAPASPMRAPGSSAARSGASCGGLAVRLGVSSERGGIAGSRTVWAGAASRRAVRRSGSAAAARSAEVSPAGLPEAVPRTSDASSARDAGPAAAGGPLAVRTLTLGVPIASIALRRTGFGLHDGSSGREGTGRGQQVVQRLIERARSMQ